MAGPRFVKGALFAIFLYVKWGWPACRIGKGQYLNVHRPVVIMNVDLKVETT